MSRQKIDPFCFPVMYVNHRSVFKNHTVVRNSNSSVPNRRVAQLDIVVRPSFIPQEIISFRILWKMNDGKRQILAARGCNLIAVFL